MISRRTRARIAFLWEVLVFPLRLYQWRNATVAEDGSIDMHLPWLVSGAALQVAHSWAYDHDLGALRTKWWRNVVPPGLLIIGFEVFPRSPGELRSLSIGGSIGRIGYRFWYGVIHPLPETVD